jgi:dihydroorotate dehydrogenase
MTSGGALSGIRLEHPLMNGAGTCKTLEDVERLVPSSVSAVVVGSITVEPRLGNEGQTYWSDATSSLNSLGLPNRGEPYYRRHLGAMVRAAHAAGKPLVLSVAGFSPDEYVRLAALGRDAGADLAELNLACPNVWDGGRQKRIACFDLGAVEAILRRVEAFLDAPPPVGLKLSPFSDPHALAVVAGVVARFACVGFVTSATNFPNALALDEAGRSRGLRRRDVRSGRLTPRRRAQPPLLRALPGGSRAGSQHSGPARERRCGCRRAIA